MATAPSKKKADMKVVILGDTMVGKTSLIQRYIDGTFNADSKARTLGASFFLKQWGPYNVAIWDTAGEERYSGLSTFYSRGAGAAILAYDISSCQSFESLWARFMPLLSSAEDNCLKVVVGTKKDLATNESRQVTYEEGQKFAEEINQNLPEGKLKQVAFFETSSSTGENVSNVYELVLETCLPLSEEQRRTLTKKSSTVSLSDKNTNKKAGCPC